MASLQLGDKVAWQKEAKIPLTSSTHFDDIDNIKQFPKCLQPLHVIWKLSSITWHGRNDTSIIWDIWAWIFRFLVLFHSIMTLAPHIFVGVDSLLLFVEESPYLIVKLSLIGAIATYQLSSIYPLIFCVWYIEKGHLHQLIENLLSIKYVKEEYRTNGLYKRIYTISQRLKHFIIICVLFQFIGWMIVNQIDNPNTTYWIIFSFIWPLSWAIFKWLPFCTAFSVLIIVLEILRIEKDLYISQIAASHHCCKCQTDENKLYFVFNDIDFDHVIRIKNRYEAETHLFDSYLNVVGLCNMHSAFWKYFIILLVSSGFFSILSAISLLYYCEEHPIGTIIMLPTFYIFMSLFLLYELADLNSASDDTKTLLSATRFGNNIIKNDKYIIDINQMLKMMEYNPIQITVAGYAITYGTVNAVAVAIATIIATALLQYFFPALSAE